MTHKLEGRRVKLTQAKEYYPTGIFQAGLTGTITSIQPDIIGVTLDEQREELEEWDNELQWYIDDYEQGMILLDEFLRDVELI